MARLPASLGSPSLTGNKLIAVVGSGEGIVNVSPTANQEGFSIETQVALWNTRPSTTFDVKRAGTVHVKFALPQLPDGATLAVRFEVSSEDSSILLRTDWFSVAVK